MAEAAEIAQQWNVKDARSTSVKNVFKELILHHIKENEFKLIFFYLLKYVEKFKK